MNKKGYIGWLAIIINLVLLSLELYGLKIIQYIDMQMHSSFYTNPIYYIYELPILLSFIITIILAVLGCILIIKSQKYKKNIIK